MASSFLMVARSVFCRYWQIDAMQIRMFHKQTDEGNPFQLLKMDFHSNLIVHCARTEEQKYKNKIVNKMASKTSATKIQLISIRANELNNAFHYYYGTAECNEWTTLFCFYSLIIFIET